jgi:hypothetical protein
MTGVAGGLLAAQFGTMKVVRFKPNKRSPKPGKDLVNNKTVFIKCNVD